MNKVVDVYKCLGNRTRLSITKELIRRGCTVARSDILNSCSMELKLSQPTLSQHFSRLVAAGILTESKDGAEKYYRINPTALRMASIDMDQLARGGMGEK